MADKRLSSTDKLVADVLSAHAPGGKTECFPTIGRIAKKIGRSGNTVRVSLRNLEHFGYVRTEADGSIKQGRRYHLLWRLDGFTPAVPGTPSPRDRDSQRHKAVWNRCTPLEIDRCTPLETQRGARIGAPPWNSSPESCIGNSDPTNERSFVPNTPCEEEESAHRNGQTLTQRLTSKPNPVPSLASPSPLPDHYPGSEPATSQTVGWVPAPEDLERLGLEAEARREAEAKVNPRKPLTAAEAFAALTPDSTGFAWGQAATALQAAVGQKDARDYWVAYHRVAIEVSEGKLTADAVLYAIAQATRPEIQRPGAAFNANLKRCRECGGKPPEKPKPMTAEPKPAHVTRIHNPFYNMSLARDAATKAIQERMDSGMTSAENRAETIRRAEATCDREKFDAGRRRDYLDTIEDALAIALEGKELPSAREVLKAMCPSLARRLSHRTAS